MAGAEQCSVLATFVQAAAELIRSSDTCGAAFNICVFDLFQCLLPHQLFDPLQVHLQQVFVVPALLLWAKKADQAQVRCEGYRRGASGNKDLISVGQRHAFFTALQTSVT